MDLNATHQFIEEENLKELLHVMNVQTGSYQMFNPFVDPVELDRRSLLRKKVESMKYEPHEFTGKSVADMGCNLGYYTFYPVCCGATKAVGYEVQQKWVDFDNQLKDKHAELFPKYKNKIDFRQIDFKGQPQFEKFDILVVHSLIHWFFIFDPEVTMEKIVTWLYNQCNEAVYFEGCVEGTEPVMKSYNVNPARLTKQLFLNTASKMFREVKFIGHATYNPQRIVVRLYK